MKKLIITISSLLISLSVMAGNENAEKSDVYYGGQKGDFSLSLGAQPVLNFVGNMFNGTVNQSFSGFGSVNPSVYSGTMLSAKFFTSDNKTFNIGAGFNCLNDKSFEYDEEYIEKLSKTTTGSKELMLTMGMNYLLRPGKRLQPVLGLNVLYAYANKNYEKSDDMTEANADYNHKTPMHTFGLIGNLGVEFFFCKSISMSAILDLGLTASTSKYKTNDWDEELSYITSKQTKFMTGRMGGNLAFNFYF